jgi:Gpi18-like mannosyltransferase
MSTSFVCFPIVILAAGGGWSQCAGVPTSLETILPEGCLCRYHFHASP